MGFLRYRPGSPNLVDVDDAELEGADEDEDNHQPVEEILPTAAAPASADPLTTPTTALRAFHVPSPNRSPTPSATTWGVGLSPF